MKDVEDLSPNQIGIGLERQDHGVRHVAHVYERAPHPATPVQQEPFLQQAKLQFRRLQGAYDVGDRTLLSDVMTPAFFAEVSRELEERSAHVPTEIVALNARIRDVVTEGSQHVASVQFNGLVREDGAAQPQPFAEIWNLTKPVDGSSGWLLAGIQQSEEPLTLQ